MRGGIDLDALCVGVCELGLPVVDQVGAICVVGGVGGAEDIWGDVRTGADTFVELGADGEWCGHGSACGWT